MSNLKSIHMKKIIASSAIILFISVVSCKKEQNLAPVSSAGSQESYASVKDFLSKNGPQTHTYTVDAATGGTFTTPQGTVVHIPSNAFVTSNGTTVTGNVSIEFKDIYKKSDMLLADVSTITSWGPLKSAGEFFIRVRSNNTAVQLAQGKNLRVIQPSVSAIDTAMAAFVRGDSAGMGGGGTNWWPIPANAATVEDSVNNYIFGLYQFSAPVDSGTWCNSDNSRFFSAYQQTSITLHANEDPALYGTTVFLIFKNVNSMVHVYQSGQFDFLYSFAPVGLQCTLVAVGVKNGQLYASFVPITIGHNQTVPFTLNAMSSNSFLSQLNSLN
jgi:hypothetical protein